MRSLFLFLFTSFSLQIFYQSKPPLPNDYFEQFSYTLPQGFTYTNDSTLKVEMLPVAAALLKHLQAAEDNYVIDSNLLYNLVAAKVVSALLQNKFELTLETIKRCRSMKPAPVYRVPFALPHQAWAIACMKHPDDKSEVFRAALKSALKDVFDQLDPGFKDDIVNAQKGSYTGQSIEVNYTALKDILDQSTGLSGNKLSFSSASGMVESYFRYYLRKNYQPVVEELLYQLSSARVEEQAVMIPMRDSIKLSALIYRNVAEMGKVPAVVSLSPYPGGNEATRGNVFATNGYIYVYVDSRGRRKSEGTFFPYENDAQDFYDIIDWVSKQPWCNGQVATSGGSYLGFTQWQAIRKPYRHPALKAINPMVSVGFGIDFPRISNTFYNYILQWAEFVSGKELNEARFTDYKFWDKVNYTLYKNRIPFSKLDSVAGLPNPFFQRWVSHPDFDSYWKSILPSEEDYRTLDLPILTITGYYDADQLGAFYYYDKHHQFAPAGYTDKHYILIGPYDHSGSQWQPNSVQAGMDIEKEAQIPIYKYVIWWYDWILKGKARPAFLKDNVNYFATGTGQWQSGHDFKTIPTDTLSFYLSQKKLVSSKRKELYTLSTSKSASGSLQYKHDIAQLIDSSFIYAQSKPFDDSLNMASPYNMIFESEPMRNDIMVTGKITAQLNLSLNVPDADFLVYVNEITSDGKSYNLMNAALRARYRNGGEHPQLLKPGEVAYFNFDDVFLYIKKIKKGSKLRLTFESANSPYYERNYGFGGVVSNETTDKPRIIEAKIQTGGKLASRIVIPYRTDY